MVYYSSAILYLGATFEKYYAIVFSGPIKVSEFTEIVHQVTLKSNATTIKKGVEEGKHFDQFIIKKLKKQYP